MDWLARVERVCAEPLSAKALRERLLDLLRPRIPYVGHVFALVDPVTLVATSPHADVPLPWPRLPETIRWRYLSAVNRVDALAGRPAASLRGITADPAESPLWAHVLGGLGVADTATVVFSDRYGVWGFLELWGERAFTPEELSLLTAWQVPVTAGIRAALARTFLDGADRLPAPGPAVVVLADDLTVRNQTEQAAATLLQLLPPDEPMAPIPAAAYNIGAALLAAEAGVPLGDLWCRVHLGGSRWVTVRASRLGAGPGADIAVSIEPSTASERSDLFARAAGLSPRESEVLGLLAIGLENKEIAEALFLSEYTVADHVKAVLAKTGSRTRQVLISRALGS